MSCSSRDEDVSIGWDVPVDPMQEMQEAQEAQATMIRPEIDDSYPPALITPTSSRVPALREVTPDTCFSDEWNGRNLLEHARLDAEHSAKTLEHLASGIRAVKRMLVKTALGGYREQEDSTKDLHKILQLSDQLPGTLGSDLMALTNAADMIREHARLAFQETSDLLADLNESRLQEQVATSKAKEARKLGRTLYRENLELKSQIDRLRQEKRALISEVKNLREEAADIHKFDSWRLLEQHVIGSMAIHEMVLNTPTSAKSNVFKEAITETCTSGVHKVEDNDPEGTRPGGSALGNRLATIRGAFRCGRGSQSPRVDIQTIEQAGQKGESSHSALLAAGHELSNFVRPRPKSPVPSLGEVSSYTEEDNKTTRTENIGMAPCTQSEDDEAGCKALPTNVAFDSTSIDGSGPQGLASPLLSPDTSPDGVVVQDYKPICDPDILRTLAIPSTEQPCKRPSPRKRVSKSLYEC